MPHLEWQFGCITALGAPCFLPIFRTAPRKICLAHQDLGFIRNKFQSELQLRELQNPSDIVKKWPIIFTLVVLIEPSNDLKETFKMFWNIRHKSIDMDRCGWITFLDNYIPRANSAFPTTDYYYSDSRICYFYKIVVIYGVGSRYWIFTDWGQSICYMPTGVGISDICRPLRMPRGMSHPPPHPPSRRAWKDAQ